VSLLPFWVDSNKDVGYPHNRGSKVGDILWMTLIPGYGMWLLIVVWLSSDLQLATSPGRFG
jgi:hypothetical protein